MERRSSTDKGCWACARARGTILLAAVMASGWLLTASLLGSAAVAQTGKKLDVAYMPIANCLQFFVALDKGYFKEQGLAVTRRALGGGAIIAPAVESGDVQVGYSNAVSLIVAHEKGFDFQIISAGALHLPPKHVFNSLLAGLNTSIKTPRDLEGKRVAINTLGNINELAMKMIAAKYGLDLKKVKLIEVGFPKMMPALRNNQIDAGIFTEPFVTLTIKKKVGRPALQDANSVIAPRFLITGWFAKKSWMAKHPDLAQAFTKAMDRATDYLNAHGAEMPGLLARYTKLTAGLAKQISWGAFNKTLKKSDLQVLIDNSHKYGFIKQRFDVSKIVSKFVSLTD